MRMQPYDRRPFDLSPFELGFVPRPPVRWLRPENLTTLHRAAGQGPDTRYTQDVLPARVEDLSDRKDIWIDYVAGTGDGLDATYSVAWAMAQRVLSVPEAEPLPRADLLIAGGDLVQPEASRRNYADRFIGPFKAALPSSPTGELIPIFAIPGRTDWSDGLDSFRDVFVGGSPIGGWWPKQTRSYFAVQLPCRWWLWGLDVKDGSPIDPLQIDFFAKVAESLHVGHRVILCEPSRTRLSADPLPDGGIDLVNELIRIHGAVVSLHLSGRDRFYARYEPGYEPDQKPRASFIVCGSGGSYTSGTDHMPRDEGDYVYYDNTSSAEYRLSAAYPSRRRSRMLSLRVLGGLIARNPGFLALLGALHLVLMLSIAGFPDGVDGTSVFLVATAMAAVLAPGQFGSLSDMLHRATTFGVPLESAALPVRLFAGANILVQVGLGLSAVAMWRSLELADEGSWASLLLTVGAYAPLVAAAGAVMAGVILLLARWLFRVHLEVLFAAAGIEDMKTFLRMHIRETGELQVFAVAIDRVCHRWRVDPEADQPDASWMAPDPPPELRLVDDMTIY